MLIKNKLTGVTWDIEDEALIRRLRNDENYTVVEEKADPATEKLGEAKANLQAAIDSGKLDKAAADNAKKLIKRNPKIQESIDALVAEIGDFLKVAGEIKDAE